MVYGGRKYIIFSAMTRSLMKVEKSRSENVELIRKVRVGDQQAFEQLLDRYKPLLDAAVQKFSNDAMFGSLEEDLRQEAILVFYNAILSYDLGSDGVEFGLYAKICVTNALISQMRKMGRWGAEQFFGVLDEEDAAMQDEPSVNLIEQESLREIDSVIRESLSDYEYRIWCQFASGKTAKEIGASANVNEKSVTNAIYRIRQKLRKLLR
ncbi:MAG: sigma-70 family RNA polymerase sigma factor [Ruminococcaceae bacterium]|nr:sigma-70 family RNA polymerase sigma factor [Oscillospiraceae bacterium]